MPNLSALSRGTQLVAGAGVLLLLLTFLDWQSVDVGPFSVGQNAWNGFWGVLMGLALLVLLAWVIALVFDVKLPLDVPEGLVTLGLGMVVFVTALLKNLRDDYSTIWSYLGVLLAAVVAAGAWLRYTESGGTVDSLRSSMPKREPVPASSPSPSSDPTAAADRPPTQANTPEQTPPSATMPDTPSEPASVPPPVDRMPDATERPPDARSSHDR